MKLEAKTGASPCPACGEHLDGASTPGNHKPVPGDFTMCAYCTSFLTWDDAYRQVLAVELPDYALTALRKAAAGVRLWKKQGRPRFGMHLDKRKGLE